MCCNHWKYKTCQVAKRIQISKTLQEKKRGKYYISFLKQRKITLKNECARIIHGLSYLSARYLAPKPVFCNPSTDILVLLRYWKLKEKFLSSRHLENSRPFGYLTLWSAFKYLLYQPLPDELAWLDSQHSWLNWSILKLKVILPVN